MKNSQKQGIETRKNIKAFIIQYIQDHGYPPTTREIGDVVDRSSSSSVHFQLKRMFEEGELETDAETGSPRAVRVPGYAFVKQEETEKCSRPLPTKDGYVQMVYRD